GDLEQGFSGDKWDDRLDDLFVSAANCSAFSNIFCWMDIIFVRVAERLRLMRLLQDFERFGLEADLGQRLRLLDVRLFEDSATLQVTGDLALSLDTLGRDIEALFLVAVLRMDFLDKVDLLDVTDCEEEPHPRALPLDLDLDLLG
ncbi:hypothetical protein THAOC_18018, partial [Thalassiosira oceanica]